MLVGTGRDLERVREQLSAEKAERRRLEAQADLEAQFRTTVLEARDHARFSVGQERQALSRLVAVIDRAEARYVGDALTEEMKAAA